RRVGDLDVPDVAVALAQVAAQVTFAELHVIQIPQDAHVRRFDGLDDADRRRAAVGAVAAGIDPEGHRLQGERESRLRPPGPRPPQPGDDVLVHARLADAGNIIPADHAHPRAVEPAGRGAARLDLLDEAVVVLGVVQARAEAPGAELRHLQFQALTRLGDGA